MRVRFSMDGAPGVTDRAWMLKQVQHDDNLEVRG
jgi:hypothetical protein